MRCLSLDHHRAGVAVRRAFAFSAAERAAAVRRFAGKGGCVALVTCNRTEFYFACSEEEAASLLGFGRAERALFSPIEGAEEHLFRLAAGLESMLVGEDEILGQLKNAYEESRLAGGAEGLHAPFQAALACGRRVRGETKISSFASSLATLAANEVFRFKSGEKRVLLVGATGKIGTSVLKNLLAKKDVRVVATSRRHGFCAAAEGAERADYEDRYKLLDGADAVISCTASQHIVFEAEKTAAALHGEKERLFIDLAVPPDIDPRVGGMRGCSLVDVDGFFAAAKENNRKKRAAAEAAEKIVAECLAEYLADEAARRLLPRLLRLPEGEKRAAFALRKADPARFLRYCERLEGGK